MDFFEAQDHARRRTKWLALWFLLAVLGVVIAVNALVFLIFQGQGMGEQISFGFILPVSVITGGLILGASGFKSLQLNAGGAVVAEDLGGRLVMPGSTDFEERKLLNIVEEMAIASGMPVPQVYLMDQEEGINAFAAGTEPSNAVIGVTRGCVQRLSRDELEGVVAHEFSHILNGDMSLNMRLIGLIFGLMAISIVGRSLFEVMRFSSYSSRRNDREGGGIGIALFILGIGLLAVGSIGVFFGRMIQAAISRQREYLADASAVQFTRNPDGIANALKKIGGLSMDNKMVNAKAAEASHMMFSDAGLFSFGLATHPPLEVRIQALQKSWDGKFSDSDLPPVARDHARPKQKSRSPLDLPVISGLGALDEMGNEERLRIENGHKIHEGLRDNWKRAAHDREEAQALVFGLLLAEDGKLRDGEMRFLEKAAGEEAAQLAQQWQGEVRDLHSARKIALIDLALPTLRGLSPLEYERFLKVTQWLIASDAQVDLFEFMLQRVVERHLVSHFEKRGFRKIRYTKFSQLSEEANVLISTMAGVGASSEQEVRKAYAEAVTSLPGWNQSLVGGSALSELTQILTRFDQASPLVKKKLLLACGRAAAADGDLANREAEMIRAIADSIGCPVPPFVEALEETAA